MGRAHLQILLGSAVGMRAFSLVCVKENQHRARDVLSKSCAVALISVKATARPVWQADWRAHASTLSPLWVFWLRAIFKVRHSLQRKKNSYIIHTHIWYSSQYLQGAGSYIKNSVILKEFLGGREASLKVRVSHLSENPESVLTNATESDVTGFARRHSWTEKTHACLCCIMYLVWYWLSLGDCLATAGSAKRSVGYLVHPLQCAHKKSDLLHDREVMLQFVQVLVQPRRPQDGFTWEEGRPQNITVCVSSPISTEKQELCF